MHCNFCCLTLPCSFVEQNTNKKFTNRITLSSELQEKDEIIKLTKLTNALRTIIQNTFWKWEWQFEQDFFITFEALGFLPYIHKLS